MDCKLAYRILILTLGLGMVATLLYSVSSFPDKSVSADMLKHTEYLALLTTWIMGHMLIWTYCFYAKSQYCESEYGYALIALQVAAWIGLVTNLQGVIHLIFVVIFTLTFTAILLLLCQLVWQSIPATLLRAGLIATLCCDILMLIMFDSQYFYLPEHLNLLCYAVFFTAFFYIHPYDEWGVSPYQ